MHQLGCLFQRTGSSDVHEGMEFCPQSCANSDPCVNVWSGSAVLTLLLRPQSCRHGSKTDLLLHP